MATKVKTEDWIEELKSISVLELSERIKALEEEFGVSATAVAAAAPAAGVPAAGEDGGAEESTTVDVVLTAPGDKKIQVIKAVRAASRYLYPVRLSPPGCDDRIAAPRSRGVSAPGPARLA